MPSTPATPVLPNGIYQPVGVTFRPISLKVTAARLITIGSFWVVAVAAFTATWVFNDWGVGGEHWWRWLVVAALVGFAVWISWLVPRQVRAWGWAMTDTDLVLRHGVMFQELTTVPFARMQFVDVNQGPLERKFNIATLQLHTASAGTDASIPGLDVAEAESLREVLMAHADEQRSGL